LWSVDNAAFDADAVVLDDDPDGATVVGVPAPRGRLAADQSSEQLLDKNRQ
jgi:serine acetyltransferase